VNAEGLPLKPPSRSTLYRMLKRWNLTNHRCKKRPKLNQGHALKCLQFSRQHRKFEWHWRTVKFSDVCSVQKGSGSNQEWAFRFPWEKWKPKMISPSGTSRAPQQMVWGAIWLDERGRARRSNLVIIERDLNAKKHGYSAQSYIEALTKGLLPIGDVHSCLCRMGRAYTVRALSNPSLSFTTSPPLTGHLTHLTLILLSTFGGS
jgi:hypothetical protein